MYLLSIPMLPGVDSDNRDTVFDDDIENSPAETTLTDRKPRIDSHYFRFLSTTHTCMSCG